MRRALIIAVAMTFAACGGGGDEGGDAAATSDESTSTTTTVADGEAPVDVSSNVSTEVGAAGGATTTPTASAGASNDAAAPEATPTPLAPGTYRFRQEGSGSGGGQSFDFPDEGKVVVDAANADGTQMTHRYVDPNGEPSDSLLRFGADGMFLLRTTQRQGQNEISCTFDPPLPMPSWPPTVGGTHEGKAACDGGITVEVTGSITGTREIEIDGARHEAFVADSTITTKGPFTSTTHQVDWFVPELRLSVHTESDTTGKFGEITFEASSVTDLLSAKPS